MTHRADLHVRWITEFFWIRLSLT